MTRSVEIPEAAVRAFRDAAGINPDVSSDSEQYAWVCRGLIAALPHLAPAESEGPCCLQVGTCELLNVAIAPAPAVPQPVDREALEQLVTYFRAQREGCEQLRAANEKTGADLTAIDYHARAETWRSAADAVLAVLAEPEAASDSESR